MRERIARRVLPCAALCAGLFLPRPAARAEEPAALLARLEQSSRSVETLSGEFVQRSRIKLFKQELVSRGRLFYRRPRRVRWEYLSPDPSSLVLDGDKAVLSMPGAAPQAFDLAKDPTMRAVFDQLTLWLGAGSFAQLGRDYQLASVGGEAAPALALTPKAGSPVGKAFSRIELRFDKSLLLRGILLREPSGDEKQIEFTRLERNAKLPPDAFTP